MRNLALPNINSTKLVLRMNARDKTTGLWFSLLIEDEEFIAFISADALCSHFKAPSCNERTLLAVYNENQQIIDTVARSKFLRGAPRPIKLTSADF